MWNAKVVLREIVTSLKVERWRAVAVVAVAAACVAAACVLELGQSHSAVALDSDLTQAGRHVLVASAQGESTIDAKRCLALRHNPATVAVGGFTEGGRVTIDKAPGEILVERRMTGEMTSLLVPGAGGTASGIVLAGPAARRMGLANGQTVQLGNGLGPAQIWVLQMEARVPDPGPWAWVPVAPADSLTECWVEVRPGARTHAASWISAWLMQQQGSVVVSPLLGEDRFRIDPLDVYLTRSTRHIWAPGGVVIGLFAVVILWFRRSEMALYRTVGSSKSQTATIFLLPYILLIVIGATSGGFVGILMDGLSNPGAPQRIATAAYIASLIALSAGMVTSTGAALIAAGRISKHIRQQL